MDILYEFQPFVFSSTTAPGRYVEGLPLKTPLGEMLESHGRICGLFELRFPAVLPLERNGKEILSYLTSLYYGKDCTNVHDHLVSCVQETQMHLEKSIIEFSSIEGIDYSLCVGVIWGSVLYVARFGGSVGLRIYRKDTFGTLFQIDKTSGSHSVVSASGYIEPHDVIVFFNDQVEQSRFPISTSSLAGLDEQHVYARLTGYFDTPVLTQPSGCVCGVYVQAVSVPSVEEEQIVFKSIDQPDDGAELDSYNETLEHKIEEDKSIIRDHNSQVFITPAAVRSFSSKIFSGLYAPSFLVHVKRVLSFFTHSRIFIIACMMLILFVGLIIGGKDYEKLVKNEKALDGQKQELLPQIDNAYKQGLYYAELNPERAKQYLQDAKRLLSQFSSPDPEVEKLIQDVDSAYATVTKTYLLEGINPYFDLSVVNAQATGSRIGLYDSFLIVSDKSNNVVYQVGTDTRSATPIIGSSDLVGLVGAEGFGGTVYAASSQGIVQFKDSDSRVTKLLDGQSSWGNIADVQVFGNSVYLLDTSNNQIWKYIPEGAGFGPVRNYVSSESVVSLADATSFSIDGNVWVATNKGEVIKFFSGKRDPFSLSGIEGSLGEIASIYADSESDYLYLYDAKGGRIVVVNKKDGTYVSSYQSKLFEGGSDVVADVKNKYLYVVNKQKIYRVELREQASTETP